jgi:iron complex transport system substrate-binding protein
MNRFFQRCFISILCCALYCVSAAVCTAAPAASPQRIASLNLCTDQLVLMLVPRARIASLSDWAARPESSYMAAAARGIPTNHGLAESALAQNPDLILAGEYTDSTMVNLLRQLGFRVELVKVPRTLDEARAYILRVGDLVGASAAAQTLVTEMDARLLRIDAQLQGQPSLLAAAYAPNGLTVGRGAVLAQIIERAGWRNLGSELQIDGYGQLSLEQLLIAQPQLLVLDVTAEDSGGGSLAHNYLTHPALHSLAQTARTVTMPPRLSECVGPMTIDAIDLLVAQRNGVAQR